MIELHEGEHVYLKHEHLEDYVGEYYAEKYRKMGAQCKIISWRVGSVGCEDPLFIKVKMDVDDMYWDVPSRMLSKTPQIKCNIPFPELSYSWITDGPISRSIISNMVDKLPTINPRYIPEKIIYNNPATIVFWKDGTKTVVKKAPHEKFNTYHAFCAALAKKILGNNSRVNAIVKSGQYQTASKNPNFVRDEKGRWVSKSLLKKKK